MLEKNSKPRSRSTHVARKRERARAEILQAALAILSEGGIEAVTLAAVADRLGMTKPALYHYFASKDALVRGLVAEVLDDEIEVLIAAVEAAAPDTPVFRILFRTFYDHYIDNLDAFRAVYCRMQLSAPGSQSIDDETLETEVHPRTRRLFDLLESRIAGPAAAKNERREARRLAFTAWTSILGLMTMIGLAEANDDPLSHSHQSLLDTLTGVFEKF